MHLLLVTRSLCPGLTERRPTKRWDLYCLIGQEDCLYRAWLCGMPVEDGFFFVRDMFIGIDMEKIETV